MRYRAMAIALAVSCSFGGAAAAQDCASANNELTNGCFTSDPTTGWTYLNGTSGASEAALCGSSCNAVLATGSLGIRLRQCFTGLAGGTYGYGFSARANNADIGDCSATVQSFASTDCSGAPTVIDQVQIDTFTESAYDSASATANLTGSESSVEYDLRCGVFGGGTFQARLDDAFFGVGLTPVELEAFSVE